MNLSKYMFVVCFGMTCVFLGCLEPYDAPEIFGEADMLVVDGFLNSSEGNVRVKLTRAAGLSSDGAFPAESSASVTLQDEDGSSYDLAEQSPGTYELSGIVVNLSSRYRLFIRTANSQEYASDFVSIKETPPIDSVTWRATDDGVFVEVNSHDDDDNTRYYRWDFVETWQYHAAVASEWLVENKEPRYRKSEEYIYMCWNTDLSTKILIGSTDRLERDVIDHFPLTFIHRDDKRISIKYSTLVKQRAISKEEYKFFEQLQQTTESIGSIFDPQPGQVTGNIHSISSTDAPPLGIFSAGNTQSKRMYIDFNNLPIHLQRYSPDFSCLVDTVCIYQNTGATCARFASDLDGTEYLGAAIYKGRLFYGWTLSSARCADCRSAGGVLTKPDFWP